MGNIIDMCCFVGEQKMTKLDLLKLEMWYRRRYEMTGREPTFGEVLVEEQNILNRRSF